MQKKDLKFILPNTLTIINLLAGTLAIVFLFGPNPRISINLIVVAAVSDVLDGLTAKLLHATSEFGKQLDSLSDLVSFGIAPSVFMYLLFREVLPQQVTAEGVLISGSFNNILLHSSFLIAVFAALRLARFNIDTRKTTDFRGLPVPANALIIISLWIAYHQADPGFVHNIGNLKIFFALLVALLSFLMISNIPMLSLKFQRLNFRVNFWRYLLLAGALILFIFGGVSYLMYIMLYYISISLIKFAVSIFRKNRVDN